MTMSHKMLRPMHPVLAGAGLLFSASVLAAPQGLYSSDALLDADVYAKSGSSEAVGEVEDVLLDDNMRVQALVIDTGNLLDMGDKQYVVGVEDFTVDTENADNLDTMTYRVQLDLAADAISEQPEYTDTWWNEARQNLQQAWSETKEGANSAWETTQSTASSMFDKAGNALKSFGDKTQQAAGNAADATQEAADNAANATGEAVESAGEATQEAADNASQ